MAKRIVLSLTETGNDGKAANKMAVNVVSSYHKLSVQLHQIACIAFFRAAQYGDTDSLNILHKGMRVNDQTALRVWVGQHGTYADLDNADVRPWIKFTKDKGFFIVKGTEEHRKDVFSIEPEDNRTVLLSLKPFYDKDVRDKDAVTLETLMHILERAAKQVTKKATDENIALPPSIVQTLKSLDREVRVELEAIDRVKENAEENNA